MARVKIILFALIGVLLVSNVLASEAEKEYVKKSHLEGGKIWNKSAANETRAVNTKVQKVIVKKPGEKIEEDREHKLAKKIIVAKKIEQENAEAKVHKAEIIKAELEEAEHCEEKKQKVIPVKVVRAEAEQYEEEAEYSGMEEQEEEAELGEKLKAYHIKEKKIAHIRAKKEEKNCEEQEATELKKGEHLATEQQETQEKKFDVKAHFVRAEGEDKACGCKGKQGVDFQRMMIPYIRAQSMIIRADKPCEEEQAAVVQRFTLPFMTSQRWIVKAETPCEQKDKLAALEQTEETENSEDTQMIQGQNIALRDMILKAIGEGNTENNVIDLSGLYSAGRADFGAQMLNKYAWIRAGRGGLVRENKTREVGHIKHKRVMGVRNMMNRLKGRGALRGGF